MRQLRVALLFTSLILSAPAAFASSGITYHGRLIKPDGTPVTASNVQFRLQIRTPGVEDCLLFEETQTHDLSNTNGVFAISLSDGNGVRQDTHHTWSLFEALSNRKAFTFVGGDCTGASAYTPSSTDNRKFRVYFNDGAFAGWEALPTQAINYIPMSIESYAVGGFNASSLVRVETAGTLGNISPLNATQYGELLALTAGTSTQYSSPNELNGSTLPPIGAGQSVRWSGAAWEAYTPPSNASPPTCTAGQVLFSNGSALSCITDGGAAAIDGDDITSGTIGGTTAWNTSGNIQTSGTISATGAITGASLSGSAVSTRDLRVYESTNTNFVSIQAPSGLTPNYTLTLPANDGGAGDFLSTDGSGALSWVAQSNVNVGLSNIRSTINPLNHVFPSVACTTSQTLRYNASTDQYECSTISASGIAMTSLNSQTGSVQTFANGTAGTDPAFVSATNTHTLNIPMAATAGVNAGLISKAQYDVFAGKQNALGFTPLDPASNLSDVASAATSRTNLGLGTAATLNTGTVNGNIPVVGAGNKLPASIIPDVSGGTITNTPAGDIAATTVQAAINELDAEKVSKAGDTMTGALILPSNGLTVGTNQLIVNGGNLGVGTATPSTRLHVNGTVKVANGGETCAVGADGGMIRYSSGNIQFCNGSAWQTLGVSGAGLTSLNGQNGSTQTFDIGTAGNAPDFVSGSNVHTLNIPMAATSGVTAGLISKAQYDVFNAKQSALGFTPLNPANNLSDLASAATSRTNLGLGTGATLNTGTANGNIPVIGAGDKLPASIIPDVSGGTITNTPAGTIAATTVQAAINELDSEKVAKAGDTMTGALTLNASSEVRFADSDSSNYVGFKSPAAVTTNRIWTLPAADGTSGQILSTNGSGTLSWASAATGTGDLLNGGNAGAVVVGSNDNSLTLESNNLARMTILSGGNVGIGTTNPTARLHVDGTGVDVFKVNAGANEGLRVDQWGQVILNEAYGVGWNSTLNQTVMGAFNETYLVSGSGKLDGVAQNIYLLPYAGGSVGVGTTAPGRLLHVHGAMRMTAINPSTLTSPSTGDMVIDSSDGNKFKWHNGSGWQTVGVSQTFANGTSGTAPAFSSAGTTHTLNIPMANASGSVTAGLISNADHVAFSAKLGAVAGSTLTSGQMWVGSAGNVAAAVTMSGDGTMSNAGALAVTRIQGNPVLAGTPTDGQVLRYHGTNSRYQTAHLTVSDIRSAANMAISVFPTSCTASQTMTWSALTDTFVCTALGNTAAGNIAATTTQAAINELDSEKVAKAGDSMTGALTLNATNELRFADSDSSNYVGFRAPAAVSPNRIWTLPATDGSSGQVLSTNGSGTLSWASTSSASGDVLLGGNSPGAAMTLGNNDNFALNLETNNVARMTILNDGKVGIGTTNPSKHLEISAANVDTEVSLIGSSTGVARNPKFSIRNYSASTMGVPSFSLSTFRGTQASPLAVQWGDVLGSLEFLGAHNSSGGTSVGADIRAESQGSYTSTSAPARLVFRTTPSSAAAPVEVMTVQSYGSVGVGTTDPLGKLHVAGGSLVVGTNTLFGDLQITRNNNNASMLIYAAGANSRQASINMMGTDSVGDTMQLEIRSNAGNGAMEIFGASNHDLRFGANSSVAMTIKPSGNIGMGTTGPESKLDVRGVAAVEGSVEGTAAYVNIGAGYVIPNATLNIRRITLNNSTAITLPAFGAAHATPKVFTLTVMVKQDGTGGRTPTWAANGSDTIQWDSSASAPAPNTGANKITIYQFTKVSDETVWYASQVWKNN